MVRHSQKSWRTPWAHTPVLGHSGHPVSARSHMLGAHQSTRSCSAKYLLSSESFASVDCV
eukprot:12171247-Karenia_brevis.AAC.1